MDSFKALLSIRMMNKVPNARIREMYGLTTGREENIDGALRWFSHVEKIWNDIIAKRVYVGVYYCVNLI